jgi:hypothetical protein
MGKRGGLALLGLLEVVNLPTVRLDQGDSLEEMVLRDPLVRMDYQGSLVRGVHRVPSEALDYLELLVVRDLWDPKGTREISESLVCLGKEERPGSLGAQARKESLGFPEFRGKVFLDCPGQMAALGSTE